MVSADQVAPGVPTAALGPRRGDDAGAPLRRSRLLTLEEELRRRAVELGFDLCRVASASAPPQAGERLADWLASGAHGDMEWMAATPERRAAPRALWSDARSIIVLGSNYGADADPLAALARRERGAISLYARRRDYHEIIKGRLKQLASFLLARAGSGEAKVFVDTAPVMEKPLAQAAGIGWQGKHTNLVSRRFGSWLFLGSIFTDLALAPDAPERDHCGSCRICLDICPTNAFPAPYRLDARRCVAYLTIEHKGPIPRELRAAVGNRVFGCDDCLAVCPWNKFARRATDLRLALRPELDAPPLADLAALDDAGFRALFAATPVKRLGQARFLRNVAIAIGNSGDARLAAALRPLLDHASPLPRGAAVWALARLLPPAELASLAREYAPREPDALVRAEWAKETQWEKK
nr:tRNA epoxyqueuosine(34) reductase QueG [Methylosinus sp. Sm6]